MHRLIAVATCVALIAAFALLLCDLSVPIVSASNLNPATYKPGNGVSSPVLRRFVAPHYPNNAQTMRLGGSVLLAVIVNEKGEIINVKVSHALGMGTDEEAVAAVKLWQFMPALKGDKPVKVFIPVEVTFDKDSGRTGGAVLDWNDTELR